MQNWGGRCSVRPAGAELEARVVELRRRVEELHRSQRVKSSP